VYLSSNLRYLTGWTDSPSDRFLGALITTEHEAMVVPQLYADEVAARGTIANQRVWVDTASPYRLVAALAAEFGVARGRWALDDSVPFAMTMRLQAALPGCTFVPASRLLGPLRAQKEPGEIELMRRAGRIAQEAVQEVLCEVRPAMTAREVAAAIEHRMRRKGAEALAGSIVAPGATAARPHARPGEEPVRAGEVLLVDVGCGVEGYRSDITRCFALKEAPRKTLAAYRVVRQAYEAARAAIRPGVALGDVDRAAREVTAAAGMQAQFIHRLGHGIGLDPKEPPDAVAGNPEPCLPGHTFSVEPGVYFVGEFGVRLEDVVVVTDAGSDALTDLPRDLIVLP
jgi:Xaa-Pro aminopeptidase